MGRTSAGVVIAILMASCGGSPTSDDGGLFDPDAAPSDAAAPDAEAPDAESPDATPNRAPDAGDDSLAGVEDTVQTIALAGLLGNDTDADSDPLTITDVASGTGGTAVLGSSDVAFTPTARFSGDATFTYTVSDGELTDTATVTIAVGGVNDPPDAVVDALSQDEDEVKVYAASAMLGNDTDTEGQTLTIESVSGASGGAAVRAADGSTVTFTPTLNASGTVGFGFDYTITDGAAMDTAHVEISVSPVDDPPVLTNDTATGINEGGAATISEASLLSNDTDVDSAVIVTDVSNPSTGTVSRSLGTITFTPATNYFGSATFDYTVGGGVTATVTVPVTGVEDAIIATDDSFDGTEDVTLSVPIATLLGNDVEVDGQTKTLVQFQNASGVTAQVVATDVELTPGSETHGVFTIEYVVTDGVAPDVGLISIDFAEVDDSPVANPDSMTIPMDAATTIALATWFANDTDVDTPHANLTSSGVVPQDDDCDADVNLGETDVTITPDPGFVGICVIGYFVNDGSSVAGSQVTVTVSAGALVANDDDVGTVENKAAVMTAASLYANDVDPSGLGTITGVSAASVGTVILSAGTLTYTPPNGYAGPATFTYTLDNTFSTDDATVTVTVAEGSCGDGTVNNVDECDDGNASSSDGCTTECNDGVLCDAQFPAAGGRAVDPATGRCFARVSATLTWSAARAQCQALGADLASPSNAGEQAVLVGINPDTSWLGVTDWSSEGTWRALDTTGGVSYTNWNGGEPNDIGSEDCAEMRNDGLWNDSRCGNDAPGYLCELGFCGDGVLDGGEQCDDGNEVNGDGCSNACASANRCGDGVPAGGEQCDDGNLDDDDGCNASCVSGPVCDFATRGATLDNARIDDGTGHCYLRELTIAHWQVAADACQALDGAGTNGYLAVPESLAESNTVGAWFGSNWWIGVNDLGNEGIYVETRTGAPVTFTNWNPGEPNNFNGNEDCATIYDNGRWNDENCTTGSGLGYTCELELP